MKIFKKLLSTVLASTMVLGMSIGAWANSNKTFIDEDGVRYTQITEEEYIERLAQSKGISIAEATLLNEKSSENRQKSIMRAYPDKQAYYTAQKKFMFNDDVSITLQATLKIYQHVNNREILDVIGYKSKISSGYSEYEWDEDYVNIDTHGRDYPMKSLTVVAAGNISLETTINSSVSFDLAGLGAGVTSGNTIRYTSDTETYSFDIKAVNCRI